MLDARTPALTIPAEKERDVAEAIYNNPAVRAYLDERSTKFGACRIWQGAKDKDGYGCASWSGKWFRAHRLCWQEARGPIPAGMLVCHRCDTPACIEPSHLWLGSNAENTADRDAKHRTSRGVTHAESFRESPDWLQNHPRGSCHRNAKLTEKAVDAIRKDGRSQRQIAAAYGVSQTTISLIKRRKQWSHVS